MNLHVVHEREIRAPAERLGALLDSLGGPADRLWPTERWPLNALRIDRPLAPGAPGGHGGIRYAIEAYEPGRRIVFRFAPETGLDGTHGLEVTALAPDRARLAHTLDCRLAKRVVAISPVFRALHDAIVRDLLDQAERQVTGRVARPTRHPAWVRAYAAAEIAVHRSARPAALAVPAALMAIAAVHAAWGLGSHWPAASEAALAERVIGTGKMPPRRASWAVAAALAGAAGVVGAVGRGAASRRVRGLAWTVAGALLLRGAGGPVLDLAGRGAGPYERLDLAFYSPLCLGLGLGTTAVVRAQPGATPQPL